MVKLSRYTHEYDLGEVKALYHSLRMKPVFLKNETYEDLQEWLASPYCLSVEDAPENIRVEVAELAKYKILTKTDDEDDRVLSFVRSKIPKPEICICYFILSEQCNLACKYCFLGNNDCDKRSNFLLENMTQETAEQAIKFYVQQMHKTCSDLENTKATFIFYGGEPLVNFPILEYVATRVNELRDTEPALKNAEMSMVSNGLLLNEERILRLKELGVSIAISIDGFNEESNKMRDDVAGKPVFHKILEKLDLCKSLGVNVSLSVTLSEETIKHKEDVLKLIDEYGIKGLGFNIMMSSESFVLPDSYNEAASQFIIDEFVELRKRGIYEDRMMRKLKSFTKAQVYFSDCGATAGGQLVVAPNGRVGICHGCLYNKQYFVTDIYNEDFNAQEDPTFVEWSQLTPVNRDECQECEALGICGGGCPINAMNSKPGNTIHSMDERFCVHAKKTLNFMINDLYRIISEK